MEQKIRCHWCLSDRLYIQYHDEEWGVPVHEDQKLFESLVLESAQAGLSWLTILKKREGYRKAFFDFDIQKVANMSERDIQNIMKQEYVIRHLGKIRATVQNAQAFLRIQETFGSFDTYSSQFVEKKPKIYRREHVLELPKTTKESDSLSKDLKKRGFQFVGSRILYAYMQAVGMVNDHLVSCFRYPHREHHEI
jgi:DNA-3-methyladenine glycosylase I